MNIVDLLKKNIVMVPVVASVIVGTFTGVRYIVSLTETINKNKAEITVINDTHLYNFKTYIARIQENQNHLLLNIEKNKGNTIVTNDKLQRLEEKIKQLEIDFKNLLIKRSN
jgi:peptidoglycan hydrolase CwlO-like protein